MRVFTISIFCCLLLTNCSKVETVSGENVLTNQNKSAVVSPTVQQIIELKPVMPRIKFNSKQKEISE